MEHIRLLTRADDAGLNRTSNRAIRAAVKQGIVRNVSVLATAPFVEDAAEVLNDLESMVDFGLHICLTAEWRKPKYRPISPEAKTLGTADGAFAPNVTELESLGPDPDLVRTEIEAQLDRLESLGFKPTYIDEHMLVGAVDSVAKAILELSREKGLIYDRKLHQEKKIERLPGWSGPGPHPGTELADHLSGTSAGTYLIVGHPGFKADEMQQLHSLSNPGGDVLQQRNRERRMFADIEIVDYCENAGIELLRYSDFAG